MAEEWVSPSDPRQRPYTKALQSSCPWRERVLERYNVETSLAKGGWSKHSLDHGSAIYALSFENNMLATAGHKDLKVWDIKRKKFLRVHTGHSCRIWSVHMSNTSLVSGGEDHWIKIWSLRHDQCLRTLYGHGEVLCLTVYDESKKIVSGYCDGRIRVYDLETGRYVHNFSGHTRGVKGVKILDNKLFSGSYDHLIKEWDLRSGVCIKTFQGHISSVEAIDGNEKRIISGSMNHTIRVWDVTTAQCLHTLNGHTDTVSTLALCGKRIISGSYDHCVKVWDVVTGKCLKTLLSNQNVVEAVASDSHRVIVGDRTGHIHIWDALHQESQLHNKRHCPALQFWD